MINIIRLFLVLSLLTVCCASQGAANVSPGFRNSEDATSAGCKSIHLKSNNFTSCILEEFDGHDLILTAYDLKERYIKSKQFVITSWYNEAKVRYENLLGHGTDFIIVEFEGNTGTGVSQKILAVIGWHDGRFVPVLIEPLSYYIDSKGLLTDLKVEYEFQRIGTGEVSLEFIYSYSKEFPKKTTKYNWSERLTWNDKTFSFYGVNIPSNKNSDTPNPVRKKIADVRTKVAKAIENTDNLNMNTLKRFNILNILD